MSKPTGNVQVSPAWTAGLAGQEVLEPLCLCQVACDRGVSPQQRTPSSTSWCQVSSEGWLLRELRATLPGHRFPQP